MLLDQTSGPHPTIITPPNTLAKTGSTTTTIDLSWVNGSGTAVVEVWRDGALVTTLTAGTTTYTDTGRTAGVVYSYAVRHTATGAYSPYSAPLPAYTALPTPGTPVDSGGDLVSSTTFHWTNTTALLSIKVVRDGTLVNTLSPGATDFEDDGLSPGTYVYKLAYVFGADTGSFSGTLSEVVTGTVVAPSGLASNPVSATELDLTWTNVTAGGVPKVYRDTSSNPTTLVHTGSTDDTSWNDTGRSADTVYHYRVTTTKLGVESGYSSDVSTRTLITPPNTLAVATPNTDRAALTWVNGDASAGIEVWKNGSLLTTLAATTTSYNDDAATGSPVYALRHNHSGRLSVYTSPVAVSMPAINLTSESMTATVGDTLATMTWTATKVPHDATYELTSWTDGDGDGTSTPATITSPYDLALGFTIAAKSPGVTHQVFVTTVFTVKNQAGTTVLTDTTTFQCSPYKANA